MTNASNILLYSEDVNGGIPVILNAISFNYNISALTTNEPAPGKWDITSNTEEGYRNPTITVKGVFSSRSILTSATITEQLLKAFVRTSKQKYLSIRYGDDGEESYFTNVNGTNETVTGVPYIAVSISDVKISVRNGGMNGQVLDFTINFIEDNL